MPEHSRLNRMLSIILTLVVLLSAAPLLPAGGQEEKKLTLEDLFSSPSKFSTPRPSGITWLPDGSSFLYFFREGSTNNLWRCDAATGEKELIVDWGEVQKKLKEMQDSRERAAMGEVNATGRFSRAARSLSPDGKSFLLAHEADLFIYELGSGEIRRLTDSAVPELFPAFSPDGGKVAFARESDVYWIDLATGEEKRLTTREGSHILNGVADWVYEEELGIRRSFWWSPDSQRIAYIQFDTSPIHHFYIVDHLPVRSRLEAQKYPKAGDPNSVVRLGVISLDGAETVWVDTGERTDFYIARVGWLPGSGSVWLQILNRDQTRLELLFADPESGESRLVLADEDPAWVAVRNDFRFVDDDSFIWSSDRGGWRHLYLYGTDGTLLNRITGGEWQVESVYGFDAEKKSVFFQATEKSPLERHLYRINLDGTGMARLTAGEGAHYVNLAPGGRFYIDSFSNPTTPTRTTIHGADGAELSVFDEGRIEALDDYQLSRPEFFTVEAEDGAILFATMIKPADFDPAKKYPVLVYIYGGPGSQMVTKRWGGSRYLFHQLLAQHGYIVFSIDNRGTGARGRDWLKIGHRRLGYWELKDHIEGLKYLKSLPYIDGGRIGIYGGSYGGYMTLYAMLNAPEWFKAGVSMYPVTDWSLYDTIYTERYMDTPQDNPDGYEESAPLNRAANLEGKLLLVHGTMDNNVHVQNTIKMVEKFIEAGKDFKLMLYPLERHGIRSQYRRMHFYRLMLDFLLKEL